MSIARLFYLSVVLEAMKMELGVEAPRGGRIAEVAVSEGDQGVEGAVLVTLQVSAPSCAPTSAPWKTVSSRSSSDR